jgi:hypothetical protein
MMLRRITGLSHRLDVVVLGEPLTILVERPAALKDSPATVRFHDPSDAFLFSDWYDRWDRLWHRVRYALAVAEPGPGPLLVRCEYQARGGNRLVVLVDAPRSWEFHREPEATPT